MLYQIGDLAIMCVFCFFAGALFGLIIVRYGIGLGSKLHIRAKNNEALDEATPRVIQEHTL